VTRFVAAAVISALTAGCATAPLRVAALDEVERVRSTPTAREGAELAPETYARAEQERERARTANASGDNVLARFHAQRAIAAYGHSLAVARLARATVELADAQKSLADATVQEQSVEASRAKVEREATELEERLQIAKGRLLPAASGSASAEREAARRTAARSLATEARLLCSAARLVNADAEGLAAAEAQVAMLAKPSAHGAGPVPIDDAARSRAGCLDVLTRARRASGHDDASNDTLLTELSAAGGWDPTSDERGVVVTLRGAYRGSQLTDDAIAKLGDLGRIAAAHPRFALQVVVHDALPPPPKEGGDTQRADAAARALVAGGAVASHVSAENAGAQIPVTDPSDARARLRNARLEVVFVGR
jgi:hypothetical protein